MKTVIYFIFSCFISTGALMAALGAKHPFVLYAVGFGIWALFAWGLSRRMKKKAERRMHEQQFQDFMRHQLRRPQR